MLRHLFFCSVAMLVAVTVRSSELSASVELELLANKLLGEEQPLQSAEDQLAGIQSRLNDELGALAKERSSMEKACREQTERAMSKLKSTKARLVASTKAHQPVSMLETYETLYSSGSNADSVLVGSKSGGKTPISTRGRRILQKPT